MKNSSTAALFSASVTGREQPARQRDSKTRRRGDKETRRQADENKESGEWGKPRFLFIFLSPSLSVSPSPPLLVSLSPCLSFDVGARLYDVNLIADCDPFYVLI